MAKFVESAILRVIDQSTNRLNSITKAMKAFRAEANRLKKISNIKIDPKINLGKIEQATKAVQKLNNAITRQAPVKSSTAGINQTMRALQRLQRQIQSMQGKGVNVPVTGGRGQGGRFGGAFGGGGTLQFNTGVLDMWAAGFIYRLGHTIESSIMRGFRDGVSRVDNSQTYGKVLGFTPEQTKYIADQSNRIATENPRLAGSQVRGLYNELSPTMGGDPEKTTQLVEMAANFINLRLAMGKTMEEATSGMRDIFKFLDNINRLQGPDGGVDPDVQKYFDVILRSTAASGADITPQIMNTVGKFARTFGKTMTPQGMAVLFAQAESMGRVAGSSMNRLVETLSGKTTVTAMNNQEEWGLITTKEIVDGSGGGKPKKKRVRDTTLDAELLREDPNLWFVKNIIPKLLEKGIDLNNTAQVAETLNPLFGSVVASDVALNLATWQGEWKKQQEAMAKVIVDNTSLNTFLDESTVNGLRSVGNQATEVLGEIGESLSSKLLPALNMVRDALVSISSYVGAEDGGAARSAGVLGGGALAALAGMLGVKKTMGWLTGVGGLNVAAVNLNTSAAALQAAALSLGASGVPGVPTPGGGKPTKTKVKVPMAAAGPVVPAAVAIAALATLNELVENGKDIIENPDNPLHAKEMEARERNARNLQAIKDFFTKTNDAVPSANPSLPEGTQTMNWRDSLNKFLWGDAADPNFNGKDAFGIEIGASKVSEAFNEGSEIARGKIAESTGQAGTNIASALLAAASQIGASIGASMQANFNPGAIPVTVNANAGPDTGNNPNGMR